VQETVNKNVSNHDLLYRVGQKQACHGYGYPCVDMRLRPSCG